MGHPQQLAQEYLEPPQQSHQEDGLPLQNIDFRVDILISQKKLLTYIEATF